MSEETHQAPITIGDRKIQIYRQSPSIYTLHLVLIGLSSLIVWGGYALVPEMFRSLFNDTDVLSRMLFIHYGLIYILIWASYFLGSHKYQTLRRLLTLLSEARAEDILDERGHHSAVKDEAIREKAKTSLTVSALMIASSALVFSLVSNIHLNDPLKNNGIIDWWLDTTLILAGVFSITSFVVFVITSDVLDTLLNKFAATTEVNITQHFYHFTSNPKYMGLLSIIFAISFLIAYHNASLACYAIALFLSLGYSYWFPRLNLNTFQEQAKTAHNISRFVRIILLCLPIILLCLDK